MCGYQNIKLYSKRRNIHQFYFLKSFMFGGGTCVTLEIPITWQQVHINQIPHPTECVPENFLRDSRWLTNYK